eukprot:TRINITY_DN3528_c0_g1_i1.p1 TRINITY_DN3528_c0_g1~~TRINITY_DN3528_c0_g1_i1.p1  ORF type:complete len:249 (+),score=98.52 TRINITY_DN3528_c0_g1_i1:74-748(+)
MSRKKEDDGVMDSISTFFFGKKLTPEENVKKWKREMNKEKRGIDRNIREIEREEAKVKRNIKEMAKRGDVSNATTLARELVRSKKAKERLTISKAQLSSVQMQLTQNLANYKMAGTLKKSAQIMGMMNSLIRLPEINAVMMTMAREMEKAGLIEEMMEETLDDMEEDFDEEADEQVQKVLDELDLNFKEAAPNAPTKSLQVATPATAESTADDALLSRLQSLNQ